MKIFRIIAIFAAFMTPQIVTASMPEKIEAKQPEAKHPEAKHPEVEHPEARPYDQSSDAAKAVDAALAKAVETDKRVILVMGANWCHDSRGLAGWFEQPEFAEMLEAKYHVVFVDVGYRDRNIELANRFGIKKIKGTPTVLILSPRGALLNRKTAPTWRNAASRDEADIFRYFNDFMPEM